MMEEMSGKTDEKGSLLLKSIIVAAVALTLLLVASLCFAGVMWEENGVAICTAANDQVLSQVTSDGSGGAITTWRDSRSVYSDIYAQRIDQNGNTQWTADGVAICTAANNQYEPQITSDGFGGAIITWHDERSGAPDIYAQRVDSDGVVQWTADGVAICTAADNQYDPQITSDGSGGAIITWQDERLWPPDIYAQRVDSDGNILWTNDGQAICTDIHDQWYPKITSDGSGGAIIAWWDGRSSFFDIYAQRVDSGGNVQWTANGVAICTAPDFQQFLQITSDDSGGAIITWEDRRSVIDIYAQRVDENGNTQWTANGVAICTAPDNQWNPQITSDGSGGAIITWEDRRPYQGQDIYAQRVDSGGTVQWTADGVAICTAANEKYLPQIASDGSGGAIITWRDDRSGTYYDRDIYAQRVDSGGIVRWTENGEAICTAAGDQCGPQLTSDGSGGAIITWWDYRSYYMTGEDIYAQRITDDPATIVEVSPESGQPGQSMLVTITGENTHFTEGQPEVRFTGGFAPFELAWHDVFSGIEVGEVNVLSDTELTAEIYIVDKARPGLRDVEVVTGDEVAEGHDLFEVLSEKEGGKGVSKGGK